MTGLIEIKVKAVSTASASLMMRLCNPGILFRKAAATVESALGLLRLERPEGKGRAFESDRKADGNLQLTRARVSYDRCA